MAKDQQLCSKCGGSGVVEQWEVSPPTSTQKRKLLDHAFARHQVFKHLDRAIARQALKSDRLPAQNVWEEMVALGEKAETYADKGDVERALNCTFAMASRLIYLLERADYIPGDDNA